jgi:hypothetical protein
MKTLVAIISVLFLFMSCNSRTEPEHSKISAASIIEQFVSDKLKSPSTAEFEFGLSSKIDKVGSRDYEVDSYVDSQNGFGATIRTNFHCEVQYGYDAKGDGVWKLIDLRFY